MEIAQNTCVLVADGRKLLFLRNEGDHNSPKLEVESKREEDNPATRDQGSDQPGRAVVGGGRAGSEGGQSGANHRSAYAETDFHQLQEEHFAADAADMLKQKALRNEYQQLIVVAPPKTLGELRKHYHKEVEQRLAGEVAKDLTNMPLEEIEKILQAA